jgi:hypothetical protein
MKLDQRKTSLHYISYVFRFEQKGNFIRHQDNLLQTGTLINFGGITLVWIAGKHIAQRKDLKWNRYSVFRHLNDLKIQCPVNLDTIRFGSIAASASTENPKPYVFPGIYYITIHI